MGPTSYSGSFHSPPNFNFNLPQNLGVHVTSSDQGLSSPRGRGKSLGTRLLWDHKETKLFSQNLATFHRTTQSADKSKLRSAIIFCARLSVTSSYTLRPKLKGMIADHVTQARRTLFISQKNYCPANNS
jgi:hypothetical protein